jgi:hypothetical protein
MKPLLTLVLIIISVTCFAQAGRSFAPFHIPAAPAAGAPGGAAAVAPAAAPSLDLTALPAFGLYGIGNTNTETFNNINASGKLSGYIRPYRGHTSYVTINFAFNVNASNTDTLLASTFLFPDVGRNSFYAEADYTKLLGHNGDNYYFASPFFEFSNKSIRGTKSDSALLFYTLNFAYGLNLQYLFVSGNDKVSFTLSPYLSSVKVPDPYTNNYKYLFTGSVESVLKPAIHSWGIKAAFQYNSFQVFADFRTVTGDKSSVPVDVLRGFHPNIGVIFNAEIFEH